MALLAGFADPVFQSQAVFRVTLAALANPGRVHDVPTGPAGLPECPPAAMSVLLTLLDFETPLWLSPSLAASPPLVEHLAFHAGAPRAASPQAAGFALIDVARDGLHLAAFHHGEAEYPDRSTTVIAILPALSGGPARTIAGPGIRSVETFAAHGLPDDFDDQWRSNHQRYPLGVDLLCVAGNLIIGLPRTTRLLDGAA